VPKQKQVEGKQASLNRFEVLEEEEGISKADQVMEGISGEKEKEEDSKQAQDVI